MARPCVEDAERREQNARRFYALTTLVSHLDVTPTCIDITAQPIPDRLEGRSLLPATHDPQANLRDTLFGEMHKGYATPEGPWWSGQKMAIRGK